MSIFRRLSTRRLLAVVAGALAVIAGGTAIAIAATSGGTVPAAKPLAVAVQDALKAPAVQGVTARIQFTNQLIDSSSIQGANPLITGASGRLWARADGSVRLELQSDAGDAQILSDGKTVTVFDGGSNTVYKATLPEDKGEPAAGEHKVPSIAAIEQGIKRLAQNATVSGADPTNVAGQEAYSVKIGPKHDGGLIGAAQLVWDAANGVPLKVAVYAAGKSEPVLSLEATDISFGAVGDDVFAVSPPAGAKVVDLTPKLAEQAGTKPGEDHGQQPKVTGPEAVQAELPFTLSAPDTLAGLPRQGVRLITMDGKNGAIVTYGEGLGGIAVLQHATTDDPAAPTKAKSDRDTVLPTVSIGGATGHELATALGTLVTFDKGGVSYAVVGSVPPAAAEAAARGL